MNEFTLEAGQTLLDLTIDNHDTEPVLVFRDRTVLYEVPVGDTFRWMPGLVGPLRLRFTGTPSAYYVMQDTDGRCYVCADKVRTPLNAPPRLWPLWVCDTQSIDSDST